MDSPISNNSENSICNDTENDTEYDNTIDPIDTNYNKSQKAEHSFTNSKVPKVSTTSRKRAFSGMSSVEKA